MVPEPDPTPPTWGTYTQEIPKLDLWNDYPPIKQPNYYLDRSCSICQSAILTLNPFATLTCHACQQWKSTDEDIGSQNDVNQGRDDEEEFRFQGIPLAGENTGDSEEAWCESDERAQGKEDNKGDSEEDWYSDDSQQDVHKDLHTNNCITASINATASASLAFQVGPKQDGHVMIRTHPPSYPCRGQPPVSPDPHHVVQYLCRRIPASSSIHRVSGCHQRSTPGPSLEDKKTSRKPSLKTTTRYFDRSLADLHQ
jgi:hypothetical protein